MSPDDVCSGPSEPACPDFVHGQDSSIRIIYQDGVRDAIEEETKLGFCGAQRPCTLLQQLLNP
jgi:hypothetical protein